VLSLLTALPRPPTQAAKRAPSRILGTALEEPKGKRPSPFLGSVAISVRSFCCFCALLYLIIAGMGMVAVNRPADEGRWVWVDDDAVALNQTKAMMSQFEADGTFPTLGLTMGRASNENGKKCVKKLARCCDGYCSMDGS
jgi:hypothetical protein